MVIQPTAYSFQTEMSVFTVTESVMLYSIGIKLAVESQVAN